MELTEQQLLERQLQEFQKNIEDVVRGEEDEFLAAAGVSRRSRIQWLQEQVQEVQEQIRALPRVLDIPCPL